MDGYVTLTGAAVLPDAVTVRYAHRTVTFLDATDPWWLAWKYHTEDVARSLERFDPAIQRANIHWFVGYPPPLLTPEDFE